MSTTGVGCRRLNHTETCAFGLNVSRGGAEKRRKEVPHHLLRVSASPREVKFFVPASTDTVLNAGRASRHPTPDTRHPTPGYDTRMKRGCFLSLLILGACFGGYWYVLH